MTIFLQSFDISMTTNPGRLRTFDQKNELDENNVTDINGWWF